MKKLSVLFIAVITFSFQTNTFAQQHKFEVGAEGGAGITTMWGNQLVTQYNDPTLGFAYGASFQYNFVKIFSIRTGVSYERKGCVAKGTYLGVTGDNLGEFTTHSDFNYLTLPVLLRASFGKKIKYFFNAGPYAAYLIKQITRTEATQLPSRTYEQTPYFKPRDFGLTAGAGICIPFKTSLALSFELRNNLGLYNISHWPVYGNGTLNTNSTNLLVGLAYKFGTRAEAGK